MAATSASWRWVSSKFGRTPRWTVWFPKLHADIRCGVKFGACDWAVVQGRVRQKQLKEACTDCRMMRIRAKSETLSETSSLSGKWRPLWTKEVLPCANVWTGWIKTCLWLLHDERMNFLVDVVALTTIKFPPRDEWNYHQALYSGFNQAPTPAENESDVCQTRIFTALFRLSTCRLSNLFVLCCKNPWICL